jgi:hypothetical protein
MNSWDCFDTLVARRFYEPKSIFLEVEKRLGINNFLDIRISAEKNSNGTYEEIYKNLPGIDPEIEKQIELEHCFPIIENIKKVKDGDYIVSDIYHSAEFVIKILRNCGLDKDVNFIVTSDGKYKGWVWEKIPKPDLHTGDNARSDFKIPRKLGINASFYTDCHFTEIEKIILEKDYELACWMRYIRLHNPYLDEHLKNIWIDQANYNIPMLALASLELGNDPIIFNFRDSVHWLPIYEALTEKTGSIVHSSRKCYYNPSEQFTRYIKSVVEGKVIVDLQGAGNSVEKFFGYRPNIKYIIGPNKSIAGNFGDAIEKHNCAPLGTLVGWDDNGAIRKECEHNIDIINAQHGAVKIACESIKFFKISKNLDTLKFIASRMTGNYTDRNVFHIEKHK